MDKEKLKEISTVELLEELRCRAGVNVTEVPPYEEKKIITIGPSIILEVID